MPILVEGNPSEISDIFAAPLVGKRCKLSLEGERERSNLEDLRRPLTSDACGARWLLNVSCPATSRPFEGRVAPAAPVS